MPGSLHWTDMTTGLAAGAYGTDSIPSAESCHLDTPVMADDSKLAVLAIKNVLRAADDGDLPLFAATLGIPPKEFAMLLDERSQPPFKFTVLHADLLSDWLPGLFLPLVELLWDYQCCEDRFGWLVSHAIASACFGHQHLWQDLGLHGQKDVSCLLSQYFPVLFARNTQDLNWKRFLFKELGKRLGQLNLEPPSCDGCDQMHHCFPGRKES